MKSRKLKILAFSILTVIITGFMSFLMIGITLFPIIRKYTVTNDTNELLYITPLMQLGVGEFLLEEELEDVDRIKDYITQVDNFSIINQYLFLIPPALPAFLIKDIKVNPNSNAVFYIDYESIKQEGGPQILLIKDKQNNYYYKYANFWESDKITDINLLHISPKKLIDSKDTSSGSFIKWFITICLLILILLPPYFLIKNIKLLRKEKIASL
ncbi:MAG: hypothetical protein P8O16_18635 [Algoriphagus sp.]|uniref:hypothetical protein n=1 Tax=Algoriphagus sp. TaxID=1872435 RepID=UPI0026387392|nr:hypothetical protein [Algoriphagus sp.]MDG1279302.1 hypothetical protein [Algoriphagus sp.]